MSPRQGRALLGATGLACALQLLSACTHESNADTSLLAPSTSIALSAGPFATLRGGMTASYVVTLTRLGGYTGAVTLSVAGLPTGVTAAFEPAVLTGAATSSTLTLRADASVGPATSSISISASGAGVPSTFIPLSLTTTGVGPATLTALGLGAVNDRFTAELWVRGSTAYTTTWGTRSATGRGNAVKIWDVSGAAPRLVDSVLVANASTLGDVQVSDDGSLLVVAVESNPNGGLAVFQLDTPTRARLLVRTTGGELQYGVHTAEIARVNGVLYAFCAIDPANGVPARLVIMSLANPAQPTAVASIVMGAPYIHDVFVRDGLLFTAEWNDGIGIWDIGGGGAGGSITVPRRLAQVSIDGGEAHNLWWYQDPVTAAKKYVFVGQEGPGIVGSSSQGDLHVIDVSSLTAPREVARYTVSGAGVHNVSVDEANGLLYAAFYNGGVRVLDVRGELGSCTVAQRTADGRCDLTLMGRERALFAGTGSGVYIWGVHWSPSGVFASDMLSGLWHLTPAIP